jgi:O-antigen ligase
VGIGWQAILPTAVQERMTMTYNSSGGQLDSSAQERVALWTDAMSLFKADPIIGTGFLTYGEMRRVGPYLDTHNYYLKLLVETGALGMTLFLIQLLLFFRAGYGLFRTSDDAFLSNLGLGFSSLIVCAAIVNIFGDRWMYIQVDSNLWIFLGCVVSASSLSAVRLQQPAPEADALSVMTLEAHALITQEGHQDDRDEPSIAHTPAALVNRSGDDLKLTFF